MSRFDTGQVADLAAARFDMDPGAARDTVDEYARQIAATGEDIDGDALTADQAEFILGAIAAGRDTTPPSLLDDVADAAQQLADAEQGVETATQVRDAAIRAALAAGQPVSEICSAAGVSRSRVYQVRDGRR